MKFKKYALLLVVTMIFTGLETSASQASIAYLTPFLTSITYQNVGSASTTQLTFYFYNSQDANAYFTYTPTDPPQLAPGASGSLYVGSLSATTGGFNGAVKIVSDQPILQTIVQIPQSTPDIIVRPISNGFSTTTTGSTSYIATVLKKKYGATTVFSIQNVGQSQTTITINLYLDTGAPGPQWPEIIQPGGAYIFDAGSDPNLPDYDSTTGVNPYRYTIFNGSAVVTSSNGPIAATVMEKDTGGTGAKTFEGFASGSYTMYMPSALCNYSGSSSAFAVQNISQIQSTYVTVSYYNGSNYYIQTATIPANTKASFQTCQAPSIPSPFSGTATITSSYTNIIAVGKITGAGMSTAYNGVSTGAAKLSLPYIRWATDDHFLNNSYQRAFLAIQNLSNYTQPAGVMVKYIDKNGTTYIHTLPSILPYAKANSNFSMTTPGTGDFGYYSSGSAGGGVYIICTSGPCQLAAIARLEGENQALAIGGKTTMQCLFLKLCLLFLPHVIL
jgi:hypothetical protein